MCKSPGYGTQHDAGPEKEKALFYAFGVKCLWGLGLTGLLWGSGLAGLLFKDLN